ncbi:PTPLA-domain-containing protein [Meredithblackwellia eburnea MCA 4105]
MPSRPSTPTRSRVASGRNSPALEVAGPAASSAPPTLSHPALSPTKLYLVAYNTASALAWGTVLFLLLKQVIADGKGGWDGIVNRAGGSFAKMGDTVKLVQSFAALEIAHAGLGLVRSSLPTTASQVFSRLLMVLYVLPFFPQVAIGSPIYSTMVFAWSFTEIIRYTHYAATILGFKLPGLEFLRYNTFYLLYPMGAGSEAWFIFKSAALAGAKWGPLALYGTYVLVAGWPPALAFLMTHMHSQRHKHLYGPKKKLSKKAIQAKKDLAALGDAALATPARSTRSKSKQI